MSEHAGVKVSDLFPQEKLGDAEEAHQILVHRYLHGSDLEIFGDAWKVVDLELGCDYGCHIDEDGEARIQVGAMWGTVNLVRWDPRWCKSETLVAKMCVVDDGIGLMVFDRWHT